MKKILAILALLVLAVSLTACQPKTKSTFLVPSGSPALSQLYVQNDTDKYTVDVVSGPDPLVAAFGSATYDFIFAGTNLGAKFYESTGDYIYVASIVFGNFYLVTKSDTTFDLASLDGKDITAFGANSTGDIVLRYILSEAGIDVNITYVDSVTTATSLFIADNSLIILTAEPSLSVLLATDPDLDVIDLQSEYETLTGDSSYPQSGVFAKNTLGKATINAFLEDLEASVAAVNANPAAAAELADALGYTYADGVLETAIPNSHLDFVSAWDSKPAVETYFNIIMEINPALIGGSLPPEAFYYQP